MMGLEGTKMGYGIVACEFFPILRSLGTTWSCSPVTWQTLGNLIVQETSVANYFNTDEWRSDLEGGSDDDLTSLHAN